LIGAPAKEYHFAPVDSLRTLAESFADAVEGRAPFLISMPELIDVTAAFEAVIKSLDTGAPAAVRERAQCCGGNAACIDCCEIRQPRFHMATPRSGFAVAQPQAAAPEMIARSQFGRPGRAARPRGFPTAPCATIFSITLAIWSESAAHRLLPPDRTGGLATRRT